MAKQRSTPSYGPTAVVLLALHDREFFAQLLRDPRKAMNDMVAAHKLRLEEAEIESVVKLIQQRAEMHPGEDALELWDRYHATGLWHDMDWPTSWGPAEDERRGAR